MLHAISEGVNVVCTGKQITHKLFVTFLARQFGVLNSIEDSTAEVNDKDLVVNEEVFLDLFLVRIRNIHQ